MDLLPLALSAARIPVPTDRTLDGRDPTAALAGKSASPHEALFFEYGPFSAARVGHFKLVRPRPEAAFELYNLKKDPAEANNLAAEMPETVTRLQRRFEEWLVDMRRM